MAKLYFNQQNEIDMPTLLLQTRNFDTIGELICTSDLTYKNNFNGANELSFKIYKTLDGIQNPLWESAVDCKIVYIPEFEEKFEIKVSHTEESSAYKCITGTALAESELSQVKLYHIEINTSDDIARADYDANFPTVFYRTQDISYYNWSDSKYAAYTDEEKSAFIRNSSLLHRILEKSANYGIAHVDDTLINLTTVAKFSISDTSVYEELTGEISEEYGCLFLFDSVHRTVSAYDLYHTCHTCGYRGDYTDACPVCGSTDFSGQYGQETAVFISGSNLATQIQKEGDADSLKNCFRVEGGDDSFNSAVASVNPNGTQYIYYFSEAVKQDMPKELVNGLESYHAVYAEYQNTREYVLDNSHVSAYNDVVNYIKNYFPDSIYPTVSTPLTGYEATTALLYNAIDLTSYLQTSMMPTIQLDNLTMEETMALLIPGKLSPIAVKNPATTVLSVVNNAVLGMVKILVNTALYEVTIIQSDYTGGETGTWTGKLKLTSIQDETQTLSSGSITLQITSDMETYLKQKIERKMNQSDLEEALDLSDMDLSLETFTNRLHYYSIDYLKGLSGALEACVSIILDEKTNQNKTLYENFYDTYNDRLNAISRETTMRTEQLAAVTAMNNEINEIRSGVKNALALQNHLGTELWATFCSYRREDKYSNSNYISDGLTNVQITAQAKELLEAAQRELYKAGNLQYTMSTTLNNLLAIKEFQPLQDDFTCGNWLHIQLEDETYKLRLLSYEIQFENLQTINVEFSTVSEVWNGTKSAAEIIAKAGSIAGSYSALTHQVSQSADAAYMVNDWVQNGFSATTKIVNDPVNTTITFDQNGILCRPYDDITSKYGEEQLRILPSGVYITEDSWDTVSTAIGKYAYSDPFTGEIKTVYGLLADTIVGKQVLSEKNVITNGSGTVTIDGSGIHLYKAGIDWIDSAPVSSITMEYCLSGSVLELLNPTEWSSVSPVWEDGKYMWQRTKTVAYDDTITYSEPVSISGSAGADGYTVLLSNESHTFAGDTDHALAGSSDTTITALKGTEPQSVTILSINGVDASTSATPTGITGLSFQCAILEGVSPSVTFSCNTSFLSAAGQIPITFQTNGMTFTKNFSYAIAFKGMAGEDGADGAAGTSGADGMDGSMYYLSSSATIIKKDMNSTLSPNEVNFQAYYRQGTSEAPTAYNGCFIIAESTDGTNYTTKYTSSANENSYTYTISSSNVVMIRCILYVGGSTSVALDSTVIPVILSDNVASSVKQYVLSTSSTTAPASTAAWSVVQPTWSNGNYVWTRNFITYASGYTRYNNVTYDSGLTSQLSSFSTFKSTVNAALQTTNPTTELTETSILSPRIGGGYLYMSNGTYSVEIDPNHSYSDKTLSGYLLCVRNGSDIVMGVDTSGNGYFKGELHASKGYIGNDTEGFNIVGNAIYCGTNSMASSIPGIYIGTDAIRAYSSNTAYTHIQNGLLTCVGADINGIVRADTFYINKEMYLYTSTGSSKYSRVMNTTVDWVRDSKTVYFGVDLPQTFENGNMIHEKMSYIQFTNTDGINIISSNYLGVDQPIRLWGNSVVLGDSEFGYNTSLSVFGGIYTGGDLTMGSLGNTADNVTFIQRINYSSNEYWGTMRSYPNSGYVRFGIASPTTWKSMADFYTDGHINIRPASNVTCNLTDSATTISNTVYIDSSNEYFVLSYGLRSSTTSSWILRQYSATGHDNATALGTGSYDTLIYTSGNVWKGSSTTTYFATTSTSDQRLKVHISGMELYEGMFMELKPIAFKYHDGLYNTKNRQPLVQWGFYAQDVVQAMTNHRIDWKEQELVVVEDGELSEEEQKYITENDMLKMNYQNLIALDTHMIQQTISRADAQEQEIENLKIQISSYAAILQTLCSQLHVDCPIN